MWWAVEFKFKLKNYFLKQKLLHFNLKCINLKLRIIGLDLKLGLYSITGNIFASLIITVKIYLK